MQSREGYLYQQLEDLENHSKSENLTLEKILQILGPQSHHLFIFFLIIPFLQPVPLFGLSTPFGIFIAIVIYFSYKNKPPTLPTKWAHKKIESETLVQILKGAKILILKIEKFIKPRKEFLFENHFHLINAIITAVNALLLALPLPIPFSNALPAWVIFFQTIAYLERDGLFILVSYAQALACLIYFVLLGYGLNKGVQHFL